MIIDFVIELWYNFQLDKIFRFLAYNASIDCICKLIQARVGQVWVHFRIIVLQCLF